jgi:hypothetical protein
MILPLILTAFVVWALIGFWPLWKAGEKSDYRGMDAD